jgi:membrane-bound lytic murein transglycosylase A
MVGQDTGSAIVGPARADIYFGAGAEAGRVAGRIRHPGRFVMLIPRELDPVEAGAQMPLPLPKPALKQIVKVEQPEKFRKAQRTRRAIGNRVAAHRPLHHFSPPAWERRAFRPARIVRHRLRR